MKMAPRPKVALEDDPQEYRRQAQAYIRDLEYRDYRRPTDLAAAPNLLTETRNLLRNPERWQAGIVIWGTYTPGVSPWQDDSTNDIDTALYRFHRLWPRYYTRGAYHRAIENLQRVCGLDGPDMPHPQTHEETMQILNAAIERCWEQTRNRAPLPMLY